MPHINFEFVNAPIDTQPFHEKARREQELGRQMLKLGVVVAILDAKEQLMVVHHEARDGEYAQGALAPSMETARYTPVRGPKIAESPFEIWQRSLWEELRISPDEFHEAGFFVSRDSLLINNQWQLPRLDPTGNTYYEAISFCVRVSNPGVLTRARERTEEAFGASFVNVSDLRTEKNVRQGFHEWLDDMFPDGRLPSNPLPLMYIKPVPLPVTGHDVRFDG